MIAAALIFLLWLGTVVGVVVWMRRAPDPRAGWQRLALFLLGASSLTIALGMWHRPSASLIAAVEEASEQRVGRLSGGMDCTSAERARSMVNDMSGGRIEIRRDARLRLPISLWRELGAARRATLVSLAARVDQCARGSGATDSVEVIELDSGEIIATARP